MLFASSSKLQLSLNQKGESKLLKIVVHVCMCVYMYAYKVWEITVASQPFTETDTSDNYQLKLSQIKSKHKQLVIEPRGFMCMTLYFINRA